MLTRCSLRPGRARRPPRGFPGESSGHDLDHAGGSPVGRGPAPM